MRANYTLARLYAPQTLAADSSIEMPKEQAHYLFSVMRKAEGDEVRVFNGQDGEYLARISAASRKAVTLSIIEPLRAPVDMPDIWLLFAPVKKSRTDFIIEKATEMGVSQIHPVITHRTQFPKLRMDRMASQVIEAAEQTERLDVPQVFEPVKLDALLEGWDADRALIFADEAGGVAPALTALKTLSGPAAILIGPQGGFDSAERAHLKSLPFVTPVSLGPRILRADTAAIALLTLWQAVSGDWKSS